MGPKKRALQKYKKKKIKQRENNFELDASEKSTHSFLEAILHKQAFS